MAYHLVMDGRGSLLIWRVAMNVLNEQLQTVDMGSPLIGGLNVQLTTPDDKS
jgi:hypothetical protein